MGALIEQTISTLFQGVSRQPDLIRLPGQVEEATNCRLSVSTGGISKRSGSKWVAPLAGLGDETDLSVHMYERDGDERYILMVRNGELFAYDMNDGSAISVAVADGTRYLGKNVDAGAAVPSPPIQISYPTTETTIDLTYEDFEGTLAVVDVEGSLTGAFAGEEVVVATLSTDGQTASVQIYPYFRVVVTTTGTDGAVSVTGTFRDLTYLLTPDGDLVSENFSWHTTIDFTFISNKTVTTEMATQAPGVITGTVQTFSDLPATPTVDDIYGITGDDVDKFTGYYVQWDGDVWKEIADPTIENSFDGATLPHEIVRLSSGTFEFRQSTWDPREVGDIDTVPNPDFVDRPIQWIVFFRDRYSFLSDEVVYWSAAGDFFNFWPESALEVRDADPFGRQAYGTEVQILKYAVPFSKKLWLSSDHSQFEATGTPAFTPRTGSLDDTTNYEIEPRCPPLAVADSLYFPARTDGYAAVFEYLVDDDTLTDTANDISKHVERYIPEPVLAMTGDTTSNTVVLRVDTERGNLYVYSVYWQDEEKLQSAWHRWEIGGYIHSAAHHNGALQLIVTRDDGLTYLETLRVVSEYGFDEIFNIDVGDGRNWDVRLDRRVTLTGTYDSVADETTLTVPYVPERPLRVIETNDGPLPGASLPFELDGQTLVVPGDYSAVRVIVGERFDSLVRFSKQYRREGQNLKSVTAGRLTLRRWWFDIENTGYLEVRVTPKARDTQTTIFNGYVIGDAEAVIGQQSIVDDATFNAPIRSKADEVVVELFSDSHIPFTVTSSRWTGFFNEKARQENA